MYLGHLAVGLVAKPIAPKVPLGIFLVATQMIDILYAVFLLIGLAQLGASPWDHGLVITLVWSVAVFAISFFVYCDIKLGILIGILVLSHWVGDFIAYYHVLPLAFSDTPRVGLGLYNSVAVMLIGDFGLFGGALAFYLSRTKANDRTGKWAPWLLVAYLVALMPTALLPGKLVSFMALGLLMVVPFGMWIDRHRSVIPKQVKKLDVLNA